MSMRIDLGVRERGSLNQGPGEVDNEQQTVNKVSTSAVGGGQVCRLMRIWRNGSSCV